MKTISEVLVLAQQRGVHNGKITIPIVNGVIRFDKVEYLITEWSDTNKNLDSIVDNSK